MIRTAVKKIVQLSLIGLMFWVSPAAGAAEPIEIKIATLAPEGSSWMKVFETINAEVSKKTNAEVRLKFYAGGVLGDEKDMIRKMHIGQIHGAVLTAAGLSAIFGETDVYQIPFLFQSYDEVDFVIKEMNGFFREGFEKNEHILLGWTEGGFVQLMSTTPVASLDDLKKAKVWTWADSPMTKAIFDEANIAAIPLSIPDVLVGLQTGLVDVVYAPPTGAISLQWFTKIKYVTDVNLIYLIGGVLIKKKVFEKLSPAQREILMDTCHRQMERLKTTIRQENQEAIQVMVNQGVKIIVPTQEQVTGFINVSEKAMQKLEGKSFSKKIRDEIIAKIEAFRKKNP